LPTCANHLALSGGGLSSWHLCANRDRGGVGVAVREVAGRLS
jgi:hypothetical protein